MAQLKIGDKAPEFDLPTGDGKKLSLKDLKGKKVVLYFYPKDNTSGCTKEACSFQDNLKAIQKKGAVVVGVSPDGADSHRKFAEKYELTFPLVSDEKKRSSRSTACGRRRACTAGSTWAWSGRRSSSTGRGSCRTSSRR